MPRRPPRLLRRQPATQGGEPVGGVASGRAGGDAQDEADPFERKVGSIAEVEHGPLAVRQAIDRSPERGEVGRVGRVRRVVAAPSCQPPEGPGDAPAKAVMVHRQVVGRAEDPGVEVAPQPEHRILDHVRRILAGQTETGGEAV